MSTEKTIVYLPYNPIESFTNDTAGKKINPKLLKPLVARIGDDDYPLLAYAEEFGVFKYRSLPTLIEKYGSNSGKVRLISLLFNDKVMSKIRGE